MKNKLLRELIDIKSNYYNERNAKEIIGGALTDFDMICCFYDNEELKQIKKARILKNISYEDYKDSEYYGIQRFAKLFKK